MDSWCAIGDRRKTTKMAIDEKRQKIRFRLASQKSRKTANDPANEKQPTKNTVVSIGLYTHND